MIELSLCFIAGMLAGIFAVLMRISDDIREFIDDMYEYEEEE